MNPGILSSELLAFLVTQADKTDNNTRIPPLTTLSEQIGISVSKLREQLEVAKVLGLVEVRPKTGIRLLKYSFSPAVTESLLYAISLDQKNFDAFSDIRTHIEMAYWKEAVQNLKTEDLDKLKELIRFAWEKLDGTPIQIPHYEHKELHLIIYKRIENPFVTGILDAYWRSYEAVGLNLYSGYEYLQEVWTFHEKIVQSICDKDFDTGFTALVDHMQLIKTLHSRGATHNP